MTEHIRPGLVTVVACRKGWDDLRRLRGLSEVRWCSDCRQRVYSIEDENGLVAAVAANRCVHAKIDGVTFIGEPHIEEYLAPPPLKWDEPKS